MQFLKHLFVFLLWVVLSFSASQPSAEEMGLEAGLALLSIGKGLKPQEEEGSSALSTHEPRRFKNSLGYTLSSAKKTMLDHFSSSDKIDYSNDDWHLQNYAIIQEMAKKFATFPGGGKHPALAKLSIHLEDGIFHYDIPLFFFSSFSPLKKHEKKFHEFVKKEGREEYKDYKPAYLSNCYLNGDKKQLADYFKFILKDCKCPNIKEKLGKPFQALEFYHSEQAILLYIFFHPEVWESLYKEIPQKSKSKNILQITLSILSYMDPCTQCSHTAYCMSEDPQNKLLHRSFVEFLETIIKEEEERKSILKNIKFFVQISGVKRHDSTKILYQKQKESPTFTRKTICKEFIPQVSCASISDLKRPEVTE